MSDSQTLSYRSRGRGENSGQALLEASDAQIVRFLGRFAEEKGLSLLMNALDDWSSEWRAPFAGAGRMENPAQVGPALSRYGLK